MASGPDGRTSFERLTSDTCDISKWTNFKFYDIVWYWNTLFTDENPKIGRWLGVSHRLGPALCYWILNERASTLSNVQHATREL